VKAYLDIETTFEGQISLVGLHIPGREMIQLAGHEVTDVNLEMALEGVKTVVTFNGAAFDLPAIRRITGLDILDIAKHRDLLSVCRSRGIRGGLKRVEVLFGIQRTAGIVDGSHAPRLWHRYETYGDEEALAELMAYNREDCTNLEILENILNGLDEQEAGQSPMTNGTNNV
jgi:uncharacterized protein YprB with RNaseH-like and TPR domain